LEELKIYLDTHVRSEQSELNFSKIVDTLLYDYKNIPMTKIKFLDEMKNGN